MVSIKELNSYDDRNFHVTVDMDAISNPHIKEASSHGYVFKMLNSMDSKKNHVCKYIYDWSMYELLNPSCPLGCTLWILLYRLESKTPLYAFAVAHK